MLREQKEHGEQIKAPPFWEKNFLQHKTLLQERDRFSTVSFGVYSLWNEWEEVSSKVFSPPRETSFSMKTWSVVLSVPSTVHHPFNAFLQNH